MIYNIFLLTNFQVYKQSFLIAIDQSQLSPDLRKINIPGICEYNLIYKNRELLQANIGGSSKERVSS